MSQLIHFSFCFQTWLYKKRKRKGKEKTFFFYLIVNTSQFSVSSTSLNNAISWCISSHTATLYQDFYQEWPWVKTSKWCCEMMSKSAFVHLQLTWNTVSRDCLVAVFIALIFLKDFLGLDHIWEKWLKNEQFYCTILKCHSLKERLRDIFAKIVSIKI